MIKKFLTYSLVVTTMVWSVGLLATPLAVSAAVSGDLVKTACSSGASVEDPCHAVYYFGADGKKYVFTSERNYKSWYSDFSGVTEISSTEMSSIPIGGNVTYRPGVKMLKVTTDPKVYAVSAGGVLRWITSEAVATDLYGADWASMVDDVADSYFCDYDAPGGNNCDQGADIDSAGDFDKTGQMNDASSINADKNLDGSGPVVGTGTSLTVSLASDTPATSVVVDNAARVAFTKVNLTASADGDIIIDTWKVERTGLASDAGFASIDILDASTMMPINDTGRTFSSIHVATFSEDYTIPAGTTKSVYLAGNMGDLAAYAGETPTLSLIALTLKGSGAVIGSLPITGNYQSTNTTITIGKVAVSRGAYSNSTDSTLEVGKTDYTLFSFKLANNSVEESTFERVRIYNQGSADFDGDLTNVRLLEDGTELAVGIVVASDSNYMDFMFSPIVFTKGQNRQFQIKADIVDGSARTIILGIYRASDLLTVGSTYGYNGTPTYTCSNGCSGGNPVLSGNQFDISSGTLRVGRSNDVASGNITIGSDQVLGAFEFEAKGEAITITALTLTITSSGTATIEDALNSVKLVDSNGLTVAGPTDVTAHATTVAWTDTFTVPTGNSVYTVVATLDTNGGWANNDTISAAITPSGITAKGDTTSLTLTPTPSTAVSATQQTIKAANLTVVKESIPTNKTVITNSTGVLIGSWSFDATDSGEDIRITSLAIRASTTGKFNNLTLKQGSTTVDPVNDNPVSSNNANTTSTFALSEPIVITKGTSQSISLYADIASNTIAGEEDAWGLNGGGVTAFGIDTGNSATVTVTNNNGAAITIAAGGTLTITEDASSLANRLVVGGTIGESLTEIRLKATNEDVDITKLTIFVADGGTDGTGTGNQDDLSKVYVKINGAVVGNAAGYSIDSQSRQINLQRGDLTVPQGSTGVKLSITGDLAEVGASTDNLPGTSNADIAVGLGGADGFTATGNGSNAAATITYIDSTGSAMILHKAVPKVVIENPGGSLGSTSVLTRIKITAVGGNIGVFRLAFQTTSSTDVNITNAYTRLEACSGGCGGISTGSQLAATVSAGTDIGLGTKTWNLAIDSAQSHGKQYLAISDGSTATVDLWATIGTTSNNDTVSTSLLGDTVTSTNDKTGDPTAAFSGEQEGNFVWSDLIEDDSQATSSETAKQWFNGYLVDGIGAIATTTPITIGE